MGLLHEYLVTDIIVVLRFRVSLLKKDLLSILVSDIKDIRPLVGYFKCYSCSGLRLIRVFFVCGSARGAPTGVDEVVCPITKLPLGDPQLAVACVLW